MVSKNITLILLAIVAFSVIMNLRIQKTIWTVQSEESVSPPIVSHSATNMAQDLYLNNQNIESHHRKRINSTKKYDQETLFIGESNSKQEPPFRILHIVTSLKEYNDGTRSTIHGQDRLKEVVLPVIVNSVTSFLSKPNWKVDVFLVLGFELIHERKQMILDALPEGVGLEVWENAAPISYPHNGQDQSKVQIATHGLARQHRFVIKDKFQYYDFFSAWEDDMIVKLEHVENFLEMTEEINVLKNKAVEKASNHPLYGSLDVKQLNMLIPGFVRVEVLTSGFWNNLRGSTKVIQPDPTQMIDAEICCEYSSSEITEPEPIISDRVMLWETDIKAMGVRRLPGPIDWVALLPGDQKVKSVWSGISGLYGSDKRPGRDGRYMAQQAGFMATAAQINTFELTCPGGFLPSFDDPFWNGNAGLKPQNVEFWSGGYQLFGPCGMQRILSLDSKTFSRQLLFHSSNNKQRQISSGRFVKADDFLGQLHTVKQLAIEHYGERESGQV